MHQRKGKNILENARKAGLFKKALSRLSVDRSGISTADARHLGTAFKCNEVWIHKRAVNSSHSFELWQVYS